MHILLIHQAFVTLDQAGGTRHHEMARYLADQGHRLTIIASPVSYLTGRKEREGESSKDGNLDSGVTILRTYTYSALHRSFVHRVFSFFSFMVSSFLAGLRVKDVDLVWGTSPPIFQGVTAWLLARLKGAAFLFEVRDLWPAFAIQVGVLQNSLLIRASEWLESFLYRRSDQVMVNSPGFSEHVRERGARNLVVLPNGTDTRMFDPSNDGNAFRRKHGLAGKFVVLYAGAHGMSNDLGVVLEAALLLTDRPDVAIVLLGDGKEKGALMAQAEEMGLRNVYFLASVPKLEMGQVLAAADACIGILKPIPLYATVYPNKVFDYMAAGRPVILAIDGVIRQVIDQSKGGVFVPPGNPGALAGAIRTMMNDPESRRTMGRNARRYVEQHFDRAKLAEELRVILIGMVK